MSELEKLKRENKILLDTVKRYAGQCERQIAGRPESSWNCEGYGWIKRVKKPSWFQKFFGKETYVEHVFCYMNNVGMVEDGCGDLLAKSALNEIMKGSEE